MSNLDKAMSKLDRKIAFDTNCPECRRGLYQVKSAGWRDCQMCQGTGRDPIPWAELFKVGTRYW